MLQPGAVVTTLDYMILKQIISNKDCAFLCDYVRFKEQIKSNITRNIDPLDNVHREYGDPVFELLLEKLTPVIAQTLGRAVWPTLSFYYVYHQGNQLKPHIDRSSCQWVASLCIGADSAFKTQHHAWPLYLKSATQTSEILLEEGDVLLFKGHTSEHWRTPFPGQWYASAIFGFVEQEGPYAFQKYDQRKSLGRPHVGMFHWTWGCIKQLVRSCVSSMMRYLLKN